MGFDQTDVARAVTIKCVSASEFPRIRGICRDSDSIVEFILVQIAAEFEKHAKDIDPYGETMQDLARHHTFFVLEKVKDALCWEANHKTSTEVSKFAGLFHTLFTWKK
jgi:hypothetical protein